MLRKRHSCKEKPKEITKGDKKNPKLVNQIIKRKNSKPKSSLIIISNIVPIISNLCGQAEIVNPGKK